MRGRFGISMRWWLALAFGLVAASSVVVVSEVLTRGSEDAFRERAQELVAGRAFQAAIDVSAATTVGTLQDAARHVAGQRGLAIFVYNQDGELVTGGRSRQVAISSVPKRDDAVRTALSGRRYVATSSELRSTTVAIPLDRPGAAALLAYATHPDVAADLGIVEDEVIEAGLIAVLAGALAGVLIAMLTVARIGRIARAAEAIEAGRFETRIKPGFRDELGRLAQTIDRMRERLRASFARVESERDRLNRVLERLHQGIVSVDARLRVEFANSAARRLLNREALAEGDPLPDPWPQVALRHFAQSLLTPAAAVSELSVDLTDGRLLSVVGVPVGSDGNGAVLVVTDITARERRERAEREFVENAAHQLRTPLTTIRAAIEALEAGVKEVPAERDRFLAHIDRESTRLNRLIGALLTLARYETLQEPPGTTSIRVADALAEVATRVAPSAQVPVRVECREDLEVLADRELLQEVVVNLAENSARHTDRGEIVLTAAPAAAGTVAIGVRDSGRGIAAADLDRIYDRFYGRGDGGDGFGLGLAIVKRAVEAMNGDVEIESEPGRGTVATVVLPAAVRAR